MDLKRVKYSSAIFFGVFSLVVYFLIGIIQLVIIKVATNSSGAEAQQMVEMMGVQSAGVMLILVPIIMGVVTYLVGLLAICVYNWVAKKYPISWEVKK